MTSTLFSKFDTRIGLIIDQIETGQISLPEIQRPFVWKNTKVRNLFDSMYQGYPIGYFLFWANGGTDNHTIIGTSDKQLTPSFLIIDGQQRLTALYAVMKGHQVRRENLKLENIHIAFNPFTQAFEVKDASIEKNPEWISNISLLWKDEQSKHEVRKNFIRRLKESKGISEREEEMITDAINKLVGLKDYPFYAFLLSQDAPEEEAAEIFVRINSAGVTLKQADFILTLMSVFRDDLRNELKDFCKQALQTSTSKKPTANNKFIKPQPDQLLRVIVALGFKRARLEYVYSILRGKDLQTRKFSDELREQQFNRLEEAQDYALNLQNWQEYFNAILTAGFRRNNFITSENALLYCYAIFLIGKKEFGLHHHILRLIIAKWFFMASLTGRYTGSQESQMEKDMADLKELHTADDFVNYLESIISTTLTEDYWNITIPNALASSASMSPELFAYYASLNLLEAKVLFSTLKVYDLMDQYSDGKRKSFEKHHLFTKGYLRNILKVQSDRDINQIANIALVEWGDNLDISDDPPSVYLPKYVRRYSTDQLNEMYFWHALPNNWEYMDYKEFLVVRQKLIAKVIRAAFEKLKVLK